MLKSLVAREMQIKMIMRYHFTTIRISSVQSLNRVQLFTTRRTVARQASLSTTNSWTLLKLMSIESLIPSNHLILCYPLFLLPSLLPSIRVFQMSQFFASGGQRIGVSPWTTAYQAPPSMGFSRQEYWSGVPLPSPISIHKPA